MRVAPRPLGLRILPGKLAVCRLPPDTPLRPDWLAAGLAAAVRTPDELSVVVPEEAAPAGARVERGWRALQVAGPLGFELVGILADLAGALADAGVALFALSTFDTDYLLVKDDDLPAAVAALRAAGHRLEP